MAKQQLHAIVKSCLIEIGKDITICKTVKKVEREPNLWLGQRKGKQGQSTYFIPEIYFDRGDTKKGYIFQVLDSQSKENKLIFGDIFTSILSNEIAKIYFIFPISESKRINSIISVSLSILEHRLDVKRNFKNFIRMIPIDMPKENIKKYVKEKLTDIAKKEKW